MPKQKTYKAHPPEWWTDTRTNIWCLFTEGKTNSEIRKMVDADGKRLVTDFQQITQVKEAMDAGDAPITAPPQDNQQQPPQRSKPIPEGPVFVGQVRPRLVVLDERMFILYDLAKKIFPQYQATEGQWIWDCIMGFYLDHSEQMQVSELFAPLVAIRKEEHDVGEGQQDLISVSG